LKLNINTGIWPARSATIRLGILATLFVFAVAARADSIAYEISSGRDFGTVDLNTGSYTAIGTTPNNPVLGLAEFNGKLYTVGYAGGAALYRVNTATANFTPVGTGLASGASFDLFGATNSGLYAIGSASYNGSLTTLLYSINPATGSATIIGPTLPVAAAAGVESLSNGSNTLYLTIGSLLYVLDTTTGGYTLVGNGFPFEAVATTFEDGSLFGAHNSPCCSFDTINTSTAAATLLSNEVNGPVGGLVSALAPDSPASSSVAPEPSTLGLFGAALLISGAFVRRRAHHSSK
jgi:hypothetical protein